MGERERKGIKRTKNKCRKLFYTKITIRFSIHRGGGKGERAYLIRVDRLVQLFPIKEVAQKLHHFRDARGPPNKHDFVYV
jgi:hypothetical protein